MSISELKSDSVKDVHDNFDAIMWGLVEETNKDQVVTYLQKQAFKTNKKTTPTDLGHKYHICTFKSSGDIDMTNAIIGDPQSYIDRVARLGYNGAMIKHKSMSAKASKRFMKVLLSNYGYTDMHIKAALKQI